jgi:hypothetical protein
MAYYRLYFLGGGSGPITDFHEFEVADDAAAILAAERLRPMGAMELWCLGRRVQKWEAIAAAPSHGLAGSLHERSSLSARLSRFA